jgi:hypothetical protein
LNLGLGQVSTGAEAGDGNGSTGELAELGADALEGSYACVVSGANELGGFFRQGLNKLGEDYKVCATT